MPATRSVEPPFLHRVFPQTGREQSLRYRIHLSQPAITQHEKASSSVGMLPREGTPCERVVAPVDRLSPGIRRRRCRLKMLESLSCANRLLKPLRHFPDACPRTPGRILIPGWFLHDLIACYCRSQVVWLNAKFFHPVAEISNHAVPLSFIHIVFIREYRPTVLPDDLRTICLNRI
jgi:hypothetical protein